MTELVALVGRAGESLWERIEDIWSAGDAVAVLDPDAPTPWRQRLVAALDPRRVVDVDGSIVEHPHAEALRVGDALVATTSGSMGSPSAAILTHDALTFAADASNRRLGSTGADVWLMCLPPWHIGGFSVMTRARRAGSGLVTVQPGDRDMLRHGHEFATRIAVVPAQLADLRHDAWATILVGGSAAPAERAASMVATYGMTETAAGIVYDGTPLDGVDVRLDPVDAPIDAGADGRVGEIAVRSPTLLRSYRDRPAPGVDGWFHTGDLGVRRADGTLSVLGRRGAAIRTGGETVLPERLESVISTHPAVQEVGVTSRPHPRWGREVVAVVALRIPLADARAVLVAHVREVLPRWAAPREVVLVEAVPRTPNGKVDRAALARLVTPGTDRA